jgi:hypothetical protein
LSSPLCVLTFFSICPLLVLISIVTPWRIISIMRTNMCVVRRYVSYVEWKSQKFLSLWFQRFKRTWYASFPVFSLEVSLFLPSKRRHFFFCIVDKKSQSVYRMSERVSEWAHSVNYSEIWLSEIWYESARAKPSFVCVTFSWYACATRRNIVIRMYANMLYFVWCRCTYPSRNSCQTRHNSLRSSWIW